MANSLLYASGQGLFTAVIPSRNSTGNVTYFINATDTAGNINTSNVNTYLADGEAPVIHNISFVPQIPSVNDKINITAIITDNQAIKNVTLNFSKNNITTIVEMNNTSADAYFASIGPLSSTITKIIISAIDVAGNVVISEPINITITKPVVNVTPLLLNFSRVGIGQDVRKNITIINLGESDLIADVFLPNILKPAGNFSS